MSRRIGRWVYDDRDFDYGNAGWHLDGSPLVIDFMPGMTDCEPGRGMYLGYNWPGDSLGDWMLATHLREAMRVAEKRWDESPFAVAAETARA
jgi:hypothetical protein